MTSSPLLEALRTLYDLDALAKDDASVVAVDAEGVIAWANPAWFSFCDRNGGSFAAIGLGRSYFEAIRGPELRAYYRNAVATCLATGRPFEQDYECSSSVDFRRFHMRMLPVAGHGLLVCHSRIVSRAHPSSTSPPEDGRFRDENGIVAQCSNCRRCRVVGSSTWDWVPEWVDVPPEPVSHGICPLCVGFYWGDVAGDGS